MNCKAGDLAMVVRPLPGLGRMLDRIITGVPREWLIGHTFELTKLRPGFVDGPSWFFKEPVPTHAVNLIGGFTGVIRQIALPDCCLMPIRRKGDGEDFSDTIPVPRESVDTGHEVLT